MASIRKLIKKKKEIKGEEDFGGDIIIHIGSPKTGTTALQVFLTENNKVLEKCGYIYPKIDPHAAKDPYNHSGNAGVIARSLLRESEGITKLYFVENALEYIDKLREISLNNPDKNIILSSEFFWAAQAEKLRKFRKFLERFTKSVQIVCYIRRQDKFIESAYQQSIKAGIRSDSLKEYVEAYIHNPQFNYYEHMKRYMRIFGKDRVAIRCFEKEQLYGADVRKDFLYVLGITENTASFIFDNTEMVNKALPSPYVKAICDINKFHRDGLIRSFLLDICTKLNRYDAYPSLELGNEMRKRVLAEAQSINKKVALDLLGRKTSQLFLEKVSDSPEIVEEADLTPRDVLLVLCDALFAQQREISELRRKLNMTY